jgi:deoxycytidylate deaminase
MNILRNEKMKEQRFKQKLQVLIDFVNNISKLSVSQTLKVGCVTFRKDFSQIASFGYNGTYPNAPINSETGGEEISLLPGKSGFLHAEENMIAKFRERDPENYIVLVTNSPCRMCAMRLVNAGFKQVYYINEYRNTEHLAEIFGSCNIKYGKISIINKFI